MASEDQHGGRTRPQHRVARGLWLTAGFFFVALGLIGALLPLMPTTIFLIFAAGCFARSSPRFEAWLLDHRHFGPPLRAWREHKAISRQGKVAACSGMALGYGVFYVAAQPRAGVAVLAAIAITACAVFVLTRPSHDEKRG